MLVHAHAIVGGAQVITAYGTARKKRESVERTAKVCLNVHKELARLQLRANCQTVNPSADVKVLAHWHLKWNCCARAGDWIGKVQLQSENG